MKNIYQTINYQCLKPLNFEENNPSFEVFENYPNESCSSPKIELLKNVRVSTNSVVFNYFKIFKQSCITTENYEKYQKGFRFFLKFIFPKFNFSRKNFVLITDEWTNNYYHWHVFALQRLLALKEKNLLQNATLILPKNYLKYPFILPSLARFGIDKNQITFLPKKSNIKVSQLALVTQTEHHPEMLKQVRDTLLSKVEKTDFNFGEKIYISREKQVLRFVENEKEVVALLEKYGFKKIIAEHLSYEEQISIFSKAKYLVAPHGAGITNVLFMQEGGSVLEMTTPQKPESFNRAFYPMISMLGLKYFYQQCAIGPNSRVRDHHQSSLVVDLERLEKNLKLMLQCQTS
ncbi:MAG: glycosyltransferase family 61 protein [Rickettsiales bacterium]|nr:glycosyltransferase family 61 protein [Rickettsiales bacterium]